MSFTYQMGANPPIDYPRFLIGDTVEATAIFQDEEILMVTPLASFAVVGAGGINFSRTYPPSPRQVAACLLDAMAASSSATSNALQVLDVKIDNGKASGELRSQAKALRDADANMGAFAMADCIQDSQGVIERWRKQAMRRGF